jgi:hypothetical protein
MLVCFGAPLPRTRTPAPMHACCLQDAIGRKWQCSTIQLDFNLPQRFDMFYVESDSSKQRPIMIHRAIFGSIERFFGILIENYAGAFPLWLAPVQVCYGCLMSRHLRSRCLMVTHDQHCLASTTSYASSSSHSPGRVRSSTVTQ